MVIVGKMKGDNIVLFVKKFLFMVWGLSPIYIYMKRDHQVIGPDDDDEFFPECSAVWSDNNSQKSELQRRLLITLWWTRMSGIYLQDVTKGILSSSSRFSLTNICSCSVQLRQRFQPLQVRLSKDGHQYTWAWTVFAFMVRFRILTKDSTKFHLHDGCFMAWFL